MKRRSFLKGCCTAAGASALPMTAFFNSGAAAASAPDNVLVYLYLRGGLDGLHLVVPYAGPERAAYEQRRGNMLIPEDRLRPISPQWSLHPRAGGERGDLVDSAPRWLQRLWVQDRLAIVQGAGMKTALSRSHFDAQAWMDLGTPGNKTTSSGWIARYLQQATGLPAPVLSNALGFTSTQPLALIGADQAFTASNASQFRVDGFHWSWNETNSGLTGHLGAQHRLMPLWDSASSDLDVAGRNAAEALSLMRELDFSDYEPDGGAVYPNGRLGRQLRDLANLVKSDLGIVAATIDFGGWDTHAEQGMPNPGNPGHYDYFGNLVEDLSRSLDAFYTDLAAAAGNVMNRVTVVILSEFGRNIQGNQSNGTDHGYGNVVLALGGRVNGGRFYGEFPGLDEASVFQGQDLAVTTDYRQVLAEALVRRQQFRQDRLEQVFPDLDGYHPLGVFQD
ncbi:MAG: DUF1501 domain-containing protein [Wenzhouxiangella sp.]|nr:MAG: DUF1501 domain-containing protein [Wenzhouxiangella sp.]